VPSVLSQARERGADQVQERQERGADTRSAAPAPGALARHGVLLRLHLGRVCARAAADARPAASRGRRGKAQGAEAEDRGWQALRRGSAGCRGP